MEYRWYNHLCDKKGILNQNWLDTNTTIITREDGLIALYDVRTKTLQELMYNPLSLSAVTTKDKYVAIATKGKLSLFDQRCFRGKSEFTQITEHLCNTEAHGDIVGIQFNKSGSNLLMTQGEVVSVIDTSELLVGSSTYMSKLELYTGVCQRGEGAIWFPGREDAIMFSGSAKIARAMETSYRGSNLDGDSGGVLLGVDIHGKWITSVRQEITHPHFVLGSSHNVNIVVVANGDGPGSVCFVK